MKNIMVDNSIIRTLTDMGFALESQAFHFALFLGKSNENTLSLFLFSIYSPLCSCKKSEKKLKANSEKNSEVIDGQTDRPTNQPTNQPINQPTK